MFRPPVTRITSSNSITLLCMRWFTFLNDCSVASMVWKNEGFIRDIAGR